MQLKSYDDIDEKVIEVILNFKSTGKLNKAVQSEITELQNLIKRQFISLSAEEKEIFELRYFQNLSCADIEKRTGKPKDYISKIISSATKNIKEKIKAAKRGAPLKEELKNVRLDETKAAKALLYFNRFLSAVIFIVLIIFFYFFIGKNFSACLAYLNKVHYEIRDYLKETVSVNNLKWKTNQSLLYKSSLRKIKVSGSTSLIQLSKKWNDTFKKNHPAYRISFLPTDSDSGINALINRKIDIANSSRPATFSDEQKALQKGLSLSEYRIALDALVIVVNAANPVQELSLDDLKNIFTGEIKNWKEFNDLDLSIVPLIREEGSGTNEFVINRILQGALLPDLFLKIKSAGEIINFISKNKGAIGFINSANYPWDNKQVRFLKIKTYNDSLSVSPYEDKKLNEEAIRYGDYPLAHYLYLITLKEANEKVRDYVDWVLGSEGQKIVSELGLLPVIE